MNTSKALTVRRTWRNVQQNMEKMEEGVLKLMAHPESTPDQLKLANKLYADVRKRMQETEMLMALHYPRHR